MTRLNKVFFNVVIKLWSSFGKGMILVWLTLFMIYLPPAKANQKMLISRNDNGREITLTSGDLVEISLESRGATGYLWSFTGLDPEYLEIVKEETTSESEDTVTGGPVTHIWTLRTRKNGLTEIRMSYTRPWEEKKAAADVFAIRLRILR